MVNISPNKTHLLKRIYRRLLVEPWVIFYWEILPGLSRREDYSISPMPTKELKIPITVLTYNRPDYLKETLESFLEFNKSILDRFLIIVLAQEDNNLATNKILDRYQQHFYKVIHTKNNIGCSRGYSFLMYEALKLGLPLIIHLEDDFVTNEPLIDYLPGMIEIMCKMSDLGYIRLRSNKDTVNQFNSISGRKITHKQLINKTLIGNAHFTLNPTLCKASVINKIVPFDSEREAMKKYQKLGLRSGQLISNCFSHIGHDRVNDWIE